MWPALHGVNICLRERAWHAELVCWGIKKRGFRVGVGHAASWVQCLQIKRTISSFLRQTIPARSHGWSSNGADWISGNWICGERLATSDTTVNLFSIDRVEWFRGKMDDIRVYSRGICCPTKLLFSFSTLINNNRTLIVFFFYPSEKSTPGGREMARFDVFSSVLIGHQGRHCK